MLPLQLFFPFGMIGTCIEAVSPVENKPIKRRLMLLFQFPVFRQYVFHISKCTFCFVLKYAVHVVLRSGRNTVLPGKSICQRCLDLQFTFPCEH